jgi:hypothetical protein
MGVWNQPDRRGKILWAATLAGSMLLFLLGCNDTSSLFGTTSAVTSDFPGCISATALDTTQINLTYQIPPQAVSMNLYRNGSVAARVTPGMGSVYTDFGLLEAATYYYSCEAVYADTTTAMGTQTVSATTIDMDAPTFSGILSVTVVSSSSVQVTWNLPSSLGVQAVYYEIFANPGASVNWTAAPRMTVPVGAISAIQGNLGDLLTYSFGVRACTATHICDTNTAQLQGSLPTSGQPPLTPGATSVVLSNGKAVITAPWTDSEGAVANRLVYQKTGAPTALLSDYALTQTFVVNPAAYGNVPTSLSINGLSQNTQYSWIVEDQDPNNLQNANLNAVTLTTGDLSPPTFGGVSSVALGTPADQTIVASFTAINREGNASGSSDPNDSNGAASYLVYLASVPWPSTPPNACANGVPYGAPISTVGYAPGPQTITISGLTQRTTYSVCLLAVDAAGNISTNTNAATITTVDITPPVFTGIQSITYTNATSQLTVGWNASASTDTQEYHVHLWKNTATPTPAQITTFVVSNPSASSANYVNANFAMSNNDVVYSTVDACDTAAALPGGAMNCTSYATSTGKSVSLGLINPPQGFTGINSGTTTAGVTQGTINVGWNNPPAIDWPTYKGFRIYSVDSSNNLTWLQDCACTTCNGTSPADLGCTVTGLNARRTYTLYVQAYDSAGNLTTYLTPVSSYTASSTTTDTTPPVFFSSLSVGLSPTFALSWNAATDNQYASQSGAVINYQIYQKIGSTFGTPSQPYSDGTLRTTTQSLTFTDSAFVQGNTYFYTICAVDASGNRTCDGNVKSFTVSDITPPVIASFTSTKSSTNKTWSLSWSATDNITPTVSIAYAVYASYTASAGTATTANTLVYNGTGSSGTNGLTGQINTQGYVNYLLVARDQAGNTSNATLSVPYNNLITVTAIARAGGLTSGGNTVLITGTGFTSAALSGFATGTTATVANATCTSPVFISTTLISCIAPASGAGAVNVVVANPDGSSATLTNGYTYYSPGTSPFVCDNPGSWGTYFAGGLGSSAVPYLVCNETQLANIGLNGTQCGGLSCIMGNFYFQLADNIDLTPNSSGTCSGATCFTGIGSNNALPIFNGTFDGNNLMIANWTYNAGSASYVGLFNAINYYSTDSTTIKNLVLNNVNLTTTGSFIGGVIGADLGPYNGAGAGTYSNITVTGSLTGNNYVGGVAGYTAGSTESFSSINTNVAITGTGNDLGGIIGGLSAPVFSLTNCTAQGNVIGNPGAAWGSNIGGVIGIAAGGGTSFAVTGCQASGNVSGQGYNIGGFIGAYETNRAGSNISNSSARGTVTLNLANAPSAMSYSAGQGGLGGFVGYLQLNGTSSMITKSIASGNVVAPIGTTNNPHGYTYGDVGGFVGWMYTAGVVSQSLSTGSVIVDKTNGAPVGGFVGVDQSGTIQNSYETGSVQGNSPGAFLGFIEGINTLQNDYALGQIIENTSCGGIAVLNTGAGSGTYTANFWDETTTLCIVTSNSPSVTGTGESDANMKVESTFSGAGWDFTTPIWVMSPTTGYPALSWCSGSGC